jgi:hypothetical protein
VDRATLTLVFGQYTVTLIIPEAALFLRETAAQATKIELFRFARDILDDCVCRMKEQDNASQTAG